MKLQLAKSLATTLCVACFCSTTIHVAIEASCRWPMCAHKVHEMLLTKCLPLLEAWTMNIQPSFYWIQNSNMTTVKFRVLHTKRRMLHSFISDGPGCVCVCLCFSRRHGDGIASMRKQTTCTRNEPRMGGRTQRERESASRIHKRVEWKLHVGAAHSIARENLRKYFVFLFICIIAFIRSASFLCCLFL